MGLGTPFSLDPIFGSWLLSFIRCFPPWKVSTRVGPTAATAPRGWWQAFFTAVEQALSQQWHGMEFSPPLSNQCLSLSLGLWYHQPMRAFEHIGLVSAYPRVFLKRASTSPFLPGAILCLPCEKVLEDGIQAWCKVPGIFISVVLPTSWEGRAEGLRFSFAKGALVRLCVLR